MKKLIYAALALTVVMASCQKENGTDLQNGEDGPQAIVLGSNIEGAASTTKASVNSIANWITEDKNVYVYAVNSNSGLTGDAKLLIENIAAKPISVTEPYSGKLELIDTAPTPSRPFYYGTDEKDIYSFYAYYLGYDLAATVKPAYYAQNDSISLTGVKVNGDNDIMIAATDKAADAIIGETMINPKYVYSEYSARHGVIPNLVFKHQLSKFVFQVKYGETFDAESSYNKITLKKLSMDSQTSGTLSIAKNPGFTPEGDKAEVYLNLAEAYEVTKTLTSVGESLMLVPADTNSYNLKVYFTETFNYNDPDTKFDQDMTLPKTIKPSDVIDGGSPATSFDAGKEYLIKITVYGLEAIKVNVELCPWVGAGEVDVDPDKKEDGILEKVVRASDASGKVFYLQAKDGFTVGKAVIDVMTETAPADGKYTFDAASQTRYNVKDITVTSGKISAVTTV